MTPLRQRGHRYRPHHKRKKSWLEEIFDQARQEAHGQRPPF
jgi:hypothetical protein